MKVKKHIFLLLGVLVLFVGCLCLVGTTLAKYIDNKEHDDTNITTSEFYFSSNLLKEKDLLGNIPVYELNQNTKELYVELLNYENDLLFSQTDIKYEISIYREEVLKETFNGVILSGSCNSVKIKFNNLSSGEYYVVAKSTTPFSKTIEAKIIVKNLDESIMYSVDDIEGSTILKLILQINNYAGEIDINWNSELLPDNTNIMFEGAIDGSNSHTIEVTAYSSYVFVFYKKDITKTYTKTDFSVVESN